MNNLFEISGIKQKRKEKKKRLTLFSNMDRGNAYFCSLAITFFLLLLGGCETRTVSNENTLVINPIDAKDFINLSEIADSIKYIKLQTENDDVIGRARVILIKKKFIYVQDMSQKVVFVFDKEGKFVSKLNKRGNGPGEYLFMGPIMVDDNEESLEFIDFSLRKVIKYSNISFELLETIPFPDLNFNSSRKHEGFYYLATQQLDNFVGGVSTNAGLIVVDDKSNVKTLFEKKIQTGNSYYSINDESFTRNDTGELFLSLMFDNTFYNLKAGEAHPVFTVDFGKYGMENNSIGSLSTKEQMEYIENMNKIAAFPVLDINNSDIMSISYLFPQGGEKKLIAKEDYRLYLKFKKNDKVYHTKRIKNDLTNFPDNIYISSSYFSGCSHEAWYEDYLVDVVVPDRYFSKLTDSLVVDGIGEITAMDNPVILLMKLKKR